MKHERHTSTFHKFDVSAASSSIAVEHMAVAVLKYLPFSRLYYRSSAASDTYNKCYVTTRAIYQREIRADHRCFDYHRASLC